MSELEDIIDVIEQKAGATQEHPTQWDNSLRAVVFTAHHWEQVLRILKFARDTQEPSVFGNNSRNAREGAILSIARARLTGWSRKDLMALVCAVYETPNADGKNMKEWIAAGRAEDWHRTGWIWETDPDAPRKRAQ
jgi:hypothetical protein